MQSDFVYSVAALKRSFEVEEVDTSTHSSPLSRRTHPLRSSLTSTGSQRFHDLTSRNSDHTSKDGANQRSPKTSIRRVELSGGRVAEPVSRRTEISIDISSKQVDSSPSPGITRFGLRRPEVQAHRTPTPDGAATSVPMPHRRTEVTLSRPLSQEPPVAPRRAEPPSPAFTSRIPEPTQRRVEPPSPVMADTSSRRMDINASRQLETPPPQPQPQSLPQPKAREVEASLASAPSEVPSNMEHKPQPAVIEAPTAPPESKSLGLFLAAFTLSKL